MTIKDSFDNYRLPDESEQPNAGNEGQNEHDDIETVVSDNENIEPIPSREEQKNDE